jgi:hypothetical protein
MIANLIRDSRNVDDVIDVMRKIDTALGDDDGLKWFNFLYLSVTTAVRADTAVWRDWPFIQRLDVVFAQLYFDAILAWERDTRLVAPAWRPLFAARHDRKIARVQFALAGMNAHINRDLPVALERLAAGDGGFPSRNGARYLDYNDVSEVLEQTEASVRPMLATGLLGHVDATLGDVDSLLLIWKVRKAREAAWTNGEVCWYLREQPLLQREYLARLDQMVAFAGRGLLAPRLGIAAMDPLRQNRNV